MSHPSCEVLELASCSERFWVGYKADALTDSGGRSHGAGRAVRDLHGGMLCVGWSPDVAQSVHSCLNRPAASSSQQLQLHSKHSGFFVPSTLSGDPFKL